MTRQPGLLVVSHPAVLPVNQLVYAELAGRGWRVDVVVPDRWGHDYGPITPEPLAALAGRFHPLPVLLPGRPQRHAYRARPLRFLRRLRPDVVFVEQEAFSVAALQWGRAARLARVPFGVQADENLDRRLPSPARASRSWVLRHAAFVAARSETAGRLVESFGATGVVDLVPHHVPEWRTAEGSGHGGFRIGFAGRLVPEKGLDVLVAAVAQLRNPVELVIAGNGPQREWLETVDLRGSRLRMLPALDHDAMAEAYAEMDVLVLPSRSTATWTEQFGRVLVEALWCGVPVVGSDSGEIPWVIELTGGGRVFPEGDAAALAKILEELRTDPDQRRALAERGRRAVEATFGVPAVADALSDLIWRAAGPPGVRPQVALVAHGIHDGGGMERACAELIRSTHDRIGYTVVAARLDLALLPLVDKWVRVRVPSRPIPLKLVCFFAVAGLAIRRLPFDLVHTVGAIVPNRVDLATVHFCHAGFSATSGRLARADGTASRRLNTALACGIAHMGERWTYRRGRVRALAAVSPGVREEVMLHYPGLPVHLTPNGVDVARFRADADGRHRARGEERVGPGSCVALFVGGDWDRKGLPLAIEALARVRTDGEDVLLWVVGRGDESRARAQAQRLGVGGAVRFFGVRHDTERFYRGADLLVLPSAYETFSLVCFEAAACGLPLVIPRLSGASELVGEDQGGLIIERDVSSVAGALRRLARDPSGRRVLGEEARRRAGRYTWEGSTGSVADLYVDLLRTNEEAQPAAANRAPSIRRRIRTVVSESRRASSVGQDLASKLRLALGPVTERGVRRLGRRDGAQRLRTIRVGPSEVSYRLNAGDIQGIREVLVDQAYRIPFDAHPRTIVDLGANIGLTSLYYGARFQPACIVAVEPDPGNAKLARRNLAPVPGATVVEAAVAARPGTARFSTSPASNLGHLAAGGGLEVRAMTMEEILDLVPGGRADLVKIDIEGGEGALFAQGCPWLDRVGAIIIELHPPAVDVPSIVRRIESAGFRHLPANSVWEGSMDAFVRTARTADR